MTSEKKVKTLWPAAFIEDTKSRPRFRVTIMHGRYAYGAMKSWAWKSAWDMIAQDEELSKGEPMPLN